jgi:hypothetical protein
MQNVPEKQVLIIFSSETSSERMMLEKCQGPLLWQPVGIGQAFPAGDILFCSFSMRLGRSDDADRRVLLAR